MYIKNKATAKQTQRQSKDKAKTKQRQSNQHAICK
jgi:hypothetical protein